MPQMLDAMKYTHKPQATLKNMMPMKIIMYCIIFCCMAACSSAGGGMNIFCCQMNSAIVTSGNTLRYGPKLKNPVPSVTNLGITPDQFQSMSGAARFEAQRIASLN